jgi:hypothetical protein
MRAHLYRTILKQDASGPLDPGAQVRVLQPDSSLVISDTLYADGSSMTTISNPFTLAGSGTEYVVHGQDVIVAEDTSDAFTRMRFRGAWDAGISDYSVNDAVTYGGNFWAAQGFPTTGVIPPSDADWVPLTQPSPSRAYWSFFYTGVLVLTTGTHRISAERATTIVNVRASVGSAPTGSSIIVDVKKNGTTIFTNPAHRPTITVGTNTALASAIDVSSLSAGDYITVDITQIGSSTAGSDLTVTLEVST